ncbi:aminotransferase class III-fold pyridoxal phosphate-dependent enzyme [Candidatus Poribacteria bacterium]|nr:aminotransferase class III-fold pyridoxal phosphate-dependent enzyme [Candidatus Poribacteria bacterium]
MAVNYREIDKSHVWHPLFQHQSLNDSDLTVFKSADGCIIVDDEGKEYLDAYSALWNVNVGYGRQEIVNAVYDQMKELPYYPHSQINVPATQLAEKLASVLPGDLNHVYFCNSGSEANETAIKIARQYGKLTYPDQNRYKIISRYQGYHGFTFGAMSATGQVVRRKAFEPLVPGFHHAHPPYCHRCPLGLEYPSCNVACVEEIERMIRAEGAETVIAVIAEPIIGGGGIIDPPDDYFPRLREICDDYGLLLILDEVITGFGRTGKMFACEHWDVQPDIMTMAKGLTSGYLPLGACVTSTEVFNTFLGSPEEKREFSQVCTYGGHPAACAAGVANLEILQTERLWENAEKVGKYLFDKLSTLKSMPIVSDVRGKGLMIAVELCEADGSRLKTKKTNKISGQLKENGLIVGKIGHAIEEDENILHIAPPLILSEVEADTIHDILRDVLLKQ